MSRNGTPTYCDEAMSSDTVESDVEADVVLAELAPTAEVHDLSSPDAALRERAWSEFYPRARAIVASKLRGHFGLKPGRDDQDADDAIDAAFGILYRRCVLAPPDNPVRQPYALLVGICIHLLPKAWKRRRREHEIHKRVARPRSTAASAATDEILAPDPNDLARHLAQWLLLQLDKQRDAMPREIKAGMLGTLFRSAGLGSVLDHALASLPEARRRHCRLYHDAGLTTSQIATLCGCGPSNISNNLRRCWLVFNASPSVRRALEQIANGNRPTSMT